VSAPIVQAVGTEVAGTGAITVAWPANHDVDDVGILLVESANQGVSTPAGWTLINNTGTGTAGVDAATSIYGFYKRAASAAEASVVVADTGTRQIGVIVVVRGCIASGSPIDISATGVQATVSTAVSIPTVTTTVATTLVFNVLTNSLNTSAATVQSSSLSNANLQSLVRRLNTQSDGILGGDGGFLPVGMFDFGSGGSFGDVGDGPDLTTGTPCRVCMFVPNINTIGAQINTADQEDILLVLNVAGNKSSFTTTVGGVPTLDMAKYEANVRRFRPDDDNTAFADRLIFADAIRRRRIICYVIDEPNLNNGTVSNVPNISTNQANSMGLLFKSIWQGYDPLTLVRVPAETMASGWNGQPKPSGGWTGFDYCWSQYTIRHGRGAAVNQPWSTPISPTAVLAEQRQIISDNNLNMGVAVSLNLYAGGIGNNYDDVVARWDTDGAGGSSSLNWIRGARIQGSQVEGETITSLQTTDMAVIANPEFIRRFAEEMADDPDVPFCLFWQHTRSGGPSDEFLSVYQRADYQDALADAITTGLARPTFGGWRTAK
jgi:hypothetical protein